MEKTKIEELYENEKSKGFINHLIHAYLPISKVIKVYEFKKGTKHKCNVCGHALIDLETVMSRMYENKEYFKDMMSEIRKDLKGEETAYEDRAVIKHISHGAVTAWTGEKTDTVLCQECIQNLLNLVERGLLYSDKNITYQVNRMKRSTIFDTFANNDSLDTEEKEKVKKIQRHVENNPKHKATLGDFKVLQDLKEKMEKENKKNR